jgi:MinD-like ATPase involved in chromosome partitioning or flagellar assembly
MTRPEIALAASARDWSDRFHRFLLDHGGATVVGRMMSADQATTASFDVIFIDDVCSFLSPRLVVELRRRGATIVGVFSPDDGPDGKRRLLEVGISDVVESEAGPEEFLAVARASVQDRPVVSDPVDLPQSHGFVAGVTGPPGGVGVTEVAVGLATELSRRNATTLIDLNQAWPAVGQRLALPVHPNLRTAVDLALHEPDRMTQAMHQIENLSVVSGLANPRSGHLPSADVVAMVAAMTSLHPYVVLDLGSIDGWSSDLLLRHVDVLLVVGLGDPVGLTRLVRVGGEVGEMTPGPEIALVVNRMAGGGRQRDEVQAQIAALLPGYPTVLIPEDIRIARASWDGGAVARGPFQRQIRRLASLFEGVPA